MGPDRLVAWDNEVPYNSPQDQSTAQQHHGDTKARQQKINPCRSSQEPYQEVKEMSGKFCARRGDGVILSGCIFSRIT